LSGILYVYHVYPLLDVTLHDGSGRRVAMLSSALVDTYGQALIDSRWDAVADLLEVFTLVLGTNWSGGKAIAHVVNYDAMIADDSGPPASGCPGCTPRGGTMFGLGVAELMLVLVAVLFVFGWGRLSQLGDNFRQAIRNFKQMAQRGEEIDVTPTAPDETERKDSHHVR
jgi:Sec-independent protein translocase protein TatA